MTAEPVLPGWLVDPALARVWALLRDRVEARGLRVGGRVRFTGLSRAERHALPALVGHPVTVTALTVDLAELDGRLAARSGVGGLLAVLEVVTGSRLRDRPAERVGQATERDAPFVAARAAVSADPALAGRAWVVEWLDGVRRSGLLRRVSDPAALMTVAVGVLADLLAGDTQPGRARTELAARAAGGAHELDDGTPLAHLVLRALAAESGEPLPTSAEARRRLWERFGVLADAVSTTCLTLGLGWVGRDGTARRLGLAVEAGDPVHLTPWDLRRPAHLVIPHRPVLVCENPRVLEAVAEHHGGAVPVVCTSGQPALVVLEVLRRLRDGGAVLHYHGDFDWPGIAIANRLVAGLGVLPWRMSAADYVGVLDGGPSARLQLVGSPVDPVWDDELGAAMRHHGVAVHEEAVLADLLVAVTA